MTTVEDVLMRKGPDVVVAEGGATVLNGAKLMAAGKVGSIIIREDGRVLGIFTERDLLCRVVAAGKDPAGTLLREVMTSPVENCHLADDIQDCGRRMAQRHIRHMAVIEDEALVGLIGLRDILP
jgi:CBS domain-containing protein